MVNKTVELPPGRLWPNTPNGSPLDIEVFGATGDFNTGKTLLGLSIAPGSHPQDHAFAGKERTLYLDFEKSGKSFGGTGCQRIDVPQKLLKLKGDRYTSLDLAIWFMDLIENKIKPGQFDVIHADPITDVESGMVEWVAKNCKLFGLSEAQWTKGGGLKWGAVKGHWKQVLLKLSNKCQCFYYTSHLRQVFEGNTPVRGKKEPKGKETLLELASLYLWLDREPNDKGVQPEAPAANVIKQRIAETSIDEHGNLAIVQLLPPRLPVATVGAIRQYIATPPNYQKLKQGERVVETQLSDDDKLLLQAEIATKEAEAEENRVQRLARQEELKRLSMEQAQQAPQNPDQSGRIKQDKAKKEAADAEQADIDRDRAEAETGIEEAKVEGARLAANGDPANMNRVTAKQTAETMRLFQLLGSPREAFSARCGGQKFSGMPRAEAKKVHAWLANLIIVNTRGEELRTLKNLSKEAWERTLKEKILAKTNAATVADLDDDKLDILIQLLDKQVKKCNLDGLIQAVETCETPSKN